MMARRGGEGMDTATSADLTRSLARRAAALRYEDLPRDVRALARQCVLDYFGVALAGAAEPLVRIVREEMAEAGGAAEASVIGDKARLPALAAALVNGTAGHALDYDDVNMAMPGHPSVAILPGLLALAERRHACGEDVVAAFVAGYETACRIGAALAPGHYNLGFHATGTLGCFGAAAAAARLLGLDPERTAAALGIAGTQAAGLKSQFGTMCKPFHAGKAAQNGLLSALLARRGFSSRLDIIECVQGFALTHGPDFVPAAALAEPSGGFHLYANLFKYHAACYLTHAPIECARQLREEHRLRADMIARITLRIDRSCERVCNIWRRPTVSKASSACGKPWRWRCTASIRPVLALTAKRAHAIPRWPRCASASRSISNRAGRRHWPRSRSRSPTAGAFRPAMMPASRPPISPRKAIAWPPSSTPWSRPCSAPPAAASCAR